MRVFALSEGILERMLGDADCALLYSHFQYWSEWNKATGKNIDEEGNAWVSQSMTSIVKYFPWWSATTIHRKIDRLVEYGCLAVKSVTDPKGGILPNMYLPLNIGASETVHPSPKTDTPLSENGYPNITYDINNVSVSKRDKDSYSTTSTIIYSSTDSYKAACDFVNGDLVTSRAKMERFIDLYDLVGDAMLAEAFRKAIAANARSFSYAEAICRNWHSAGYKTIEDVRKAEEEYRGKKKPAGKPMPEYKGNDDFLSGIPDDLLED